MIATLRTNGSRRSWRAGAALVTALVVTLTAACGTRTSHSASGVTSNNGGSSNSNNGNGTSNGSNGSSGSNSNNSGGNNNTGGTNTGGSGVTSGGSGGNSSSGSSNNSGGSNNGSSNGTSSSGGTTKSSGSQGGITNSSGPAQSGGSTSSASGVLNNPIFGGNGNCSPATGSSINVGNVSTLSGVLGLLFQPVVPALQTFVKAQNNCGGINGHPIKLFVQDDQDDPSTAATAAQDEIQNNHIIAFLGNIQVLTIDAMPPILAANKIPIIGGDLTNNTWFKVSPYIFPQGAPPQSVSVGYLQAATKYYHQNNVGDAYCLEVPQACEQIDAAFQKLAPSFGAQAKKSIQISIVAPSYTSQCLAMQQAGVQVVALTVDAPTQNRFVNSCKQVGYVPHYTSYPLGVGNQNEFFGNPSLGNDYVPLNTFPWMGTATPAQRYYQASVNKYDANFQPGGATGDAGSLGWTAGALMVLAGANLPANNPTSADFLKGLYGISGATLGGLSPAPLTFHQGGLPTVPLCGFAAISNANDTGWSTPVSTPSCSNASF